MKLTIGLIFFISLNAMSGELINRKTGETLTVDVTSDEVVISYLGRGTSHPLEEVLATADSDADLYAPNYESFEDLASYTGLALTGGPHGNGPTLLGLISAPIMIVIDGIRLPIALTQDISGKLVRRRSRRIIKKLLEPDFLMRVSDTVFSRIRHDLTNTNYYSRH